MQPHVVTVYLASSQNVVLYVWCFQCVIYISLIYLLIKPGQYYWFSFHHTAGAPDRET